MTIPELRGALRVIAAGIVLAAAAPEARAALMFDVSLGAGVQQTDNLYLDPRTTVEETGEGGGILPEDEGRENLRQPVEQTIYTVNPGIMIAWSEHRDSLLLNYSGEYSMFQGDEELDPRWVHTSAADLNWRRWSPFFLEAREARFRVPRTQETETEAYVDQIDRNSLLFRSGISSEVDPRNTVELNYHGELDTYSVIEDRRRADEEGEGAEEAGIPAIDEFDRVERHYGEALVRHRWTPLWLGEVRVLYGRVERDLAPDFIEVRAAAVVDQRWSERLTLRYRLEWIREEDDLPTGEEDTVEGEGMPLEGEEPVPPVDRVRTNFLLGAEIRGELERGGWWSLSYRDAMRDQPDGDTLETGRAAAAANVRARLGSTLDVGAWYETRDYRVSGREEAAWGPTLAVRWVIAPWAVLDLAGSWTSTKVREVEEEEIEDRTTRAAAGIVLVVSNRLQIDIGYGFRENDSTDAQRSYTNNHYFGLLTFHFRPFAPGQLPPSHALGLVVGGTPSGGVAAVAEAGDASGPVR